MQKLKAQLHIHSGGDPKDYIKNSEEKIIDRATSLGFDVIAITCHDTVIFNEKLKNYAAKKEILFIPGIEKTIKHCHILILNATKQAEKIESFEMLRDYKKQNPEILVVAPHMFYLRDRNPFAKGWIKIIKNIDIFDAVEYCYFYTKNMNLPNKKAVKLAEKHNLPIIGTSDNHILKYFDRTYSLITAEKNWPSIANAIKNKKIEIRTAPLKFTEVIKICLEMEFIITLGHLLRNVLRIVRINI